MSGLDERVEQQEEPEDPLFGVVRKIAPLLTVEEMQALVDGVNLDTLEISPEAIAVTVLMYRLATPAQREILVEAGWPGRQGGTR